MEFCQWQILTFMDDVFYTIKSNAEGLYSERGSKFHSYIYPVENQEEIKEILQNLRKKYHDARHHVYAYLLGKNEQEFRACDDGEPANSSGMPVLGQIKANNLTNVLIVVVRYFGGTKLGIPGLFKAYKTAAASAIDNAEIIEKLIEDTFIVKFEYEQMKFIDNVLKDRDVKVMSKKFDKSCYMELTVRKSLSQKVENVIKENPKIKINKINNDTQTIFKNSN